MFLEVSRLLAIAVILVVWIALALSLLAAPLSWATAIAALLLGGVNEILSWATREPRWRAAGVSALVLSVFSLFVAR